MFRGRDHIAYLYVFIFFFSVFLFFSNGRFGGDGLENYLTAESIVIDHDLSIYDRPFDVKEMRLQVPEAETPRMKRYSSFGIGMPLILAPLYLMGHLISNIFGAVPHDYITQFFVSLANPLIIAITASAIFYFLSILGFNFKISLLTTVCYGFCTMSFIYTRSGFSEPIIGLLLILCVMLLYSYERTGLLRNIATMSALAGYAVLIKNNSLLYLPLLCCYILYKTFSLKTISSKLKLWAAFVAPMAVAISAYLYFHSIMSCGIANPASNAYQDIVERGLPDRFQMLKGLSYYIVGTGKGYFFYNIPLFLGLFGLGGMIRKKRDLAICLIIIVLFNLIYYSFRFNRGSLFSWGPRYLYPTIPIMCIFFAEFVEKTKSLMKKFWIGAFLIAGFIVQFPCLFISSSNYLFFVKNKMGLQEYLINYVPDLSPVLGSWHLFISAVLRSIGQPSMDFVFNPDTVLIKPLVASFSGYDGWDIWWVNAAAISPNIRTGIIVVLMVLMITTTVCFIKLRSLVEEQN